MHLQIQRESEGNKKELEKLAIKNKRSSKKLKVKKNLMKKLKVKKNWRKLKMQMNLN